MWLFAESSESSLLMQKPWIVPIPGTKSLARREENIGAAKIDLTGEDLRRIDMAAAKIKIQGARLPEAVLKLMNGRRVTLMGSEIAKPVGRSDPSVHQEVAASDESPVGPH